MNKNTSNVLWDTNQLSIAMYSKVVKVGICFLQDEKTLYNKNKNSKK